MNLAFYYHIEIGVSKNGKLTAPGFLGVFIDSLANKVNKLYLIAHTFQGEDDYLLISKNIVLIDLGFQKPAWFRHFFHYKFLSNLKSNISDADAILIRSPSPLAPFFSKYIPNHCKIFFYVVGSYLSGANEMKVVNFKSFLIKKYLIKNHSLFIRELVGKNVIANSPEIEKNLKSIISKVKIIPTTTISSNDIYWREDTCQNKNIQIIYSGRFDWQKGLHELIEAFAQIQEINKNLILNFVGWEDDKNKPVELVLKRKAIELRIEQRVIFHGKKNVGEELSKMYRMADIFILPSYHEGFPRTIWEAQANSLPVISTNVGAIPDFLTHLENVYLINPKSVESIKTAINILIENKKLRKKIIFNAFELSKENTLDFRSNQLINYVKENL